jgi:tryptophanyl-tRNA synthetase
MSNPQEIEAELQKGAQKAKVIADEVLHRVRTKVGY